MNTDAALKRFVEDNLPFLTSTSYSRDTYKGIHRAYFVTQHNKRYGLPSVKDVCTCLVATLLHRGISSETVAQQIAMLPLFRALPEHVIHDLTSLTHST